MHYYQITNPGIKDWITHEDNKIAHIAQYGKDIWVTENTAWATRVGAAELTKSEAQTICNTEVTETKIAWNTCKLQNPDQEEVCGEEPQFYTLP